MIAHNILDEQLTAQSVEDLFELILERPAKNSAYIDGIVAQRLTARRYIKALRQSHELRTRVFEEERRRQSSERSSLSNPIVYRAPDHLEASPSAIRKILIVGSCFMEEWLQTVERAKLDVSADLFLVQGQLPPTPPSDTSEYSFQVLQLPLRSLLPDFSFTRIAQPDTASHDALFNAAQASIRRMLDAGMKWNKDTGLLTFVMAMPVPQQNSIGKLLPRYDLRNPVFFVERLNQTLFDECAAYNNCYFLDTNEVFSSYGKRFIFEDQFICFNHGGAITDFDDARDGERLDPREPAKRAYRAQVDEAFLALWREMAAMYRTVRQLDSVKLVVVDLDDTLWRGVIAETDADSMPTNEGWPKSLWDALLILKRRGILLAIISKNEKSRVTETWEAVFGTKGLQLSDFAVVKINWQSKSENMAEVLESVNLLPKNVVFIDDNPLQRAEVQENFPDIRFLGGNPIHWRHILLWAPETQVPSITAESSARTAMVQAQVERDSQRKSMSQEEFLNTLAVQMRFHDISDISHPRFDRALELVNKTNQFNTTGERWTRESYISAFASGSQIVAFEAADKFTDYGLVGVLVVDDTAIRQFVMSCRVMGLELELAAINRVISRWKAAGATEILARMVKTERNLPCRNIYERCGFRQAYNGWALSINPSDAPLSAPSHIQMTAS